MIEAYQANEDGDVIMTNDLKNPAMDPDSPSISLHALAGSDAPEALQVYSTHNFVSDKIVRVANLNIHHGNRMVVRVASSKKLGHLSRPSFRCARLHLYS